ncbi:MAG: hypothetical protein GX025_06525 [Clostridiales bacterium]|nr:hypothetical protein [Clostridiales bacterium]
MRSGGGNTNLARYIELPEFEEVETVPFTPDEQKKLWEDFNTGNKFTGYLLLMIYTGTQRFCPGVPFDCGIQGLKNQRIVIVVPQHIGHNAPVFYFKYCTKVCLGLLSI